MSGVILPSYQLLCFHSVIAVIFGHSNPHFLLRLVSTVIYSPISTVGEGSLNCSRKPVVYPADVGPVVICLKHGWLLYLAEHLVQQRSYTQTTCSALR